MADEIRIERLGRQTICVPADIMDDVCIKQATNYR